MFKNIGDKWERFPRHVEYVNQPILQDAITITFRQNFKRNHFLNINNGILFTTYVIDISCKQKVYSRIQEINRLENEMDKLKLKQQIGNHLIRKIKENLIRLYRYINSF